jgi:hypothetical protein
LCLSQVKMGLNMGHMVLPSQPVFISMRLRMALMPSFSWSFFPL